jgi:hypothetical protein
MTNVINLRWRISCPKTEPIDLGIFWSTSGYPTDFTKPDAIIKNANREDSCSLQLGDSLLFESTYFFEIAIRTGTAWLYPIPDSARVSVRTCSFTHQDISYGAEHPVAFADNKKIRITIDSDLFKTGKDDNTIGRWKRPNTLPGFIPVSDGFEFLVKYPTVPLDIGVKYAALPKTCSLKEVKLYRFKNNQWFLERSPQHLDSTEGYIIMTTDEISSPFIAMIDTMKPIISVSSRLTEAVQSGKPVTDDFIIKDNIANVSWKFQYAKGGFCFEQENTDTGIFLMNETYKSTLIPKNFVGADFGVRAILTISDGTNSTALNVSRRVIRDASIEVTTDSMKWCPVYTTSELDSPETKVTLRGLTNGAQWVYDDKTFRVFTWGPCNSNALVSTYNYIEYSDARDSLFSLFPGRLLWVKTRFPKSINLGTSITQDLTKSYPLVLKANSWSDVALPFNFNVTIGDILDSTVISPKQEDCLGICSWVTDELKNYSLKPIYFSSLGIDSLRDKSTQMRARTGSGIGGAFSIYNFFNEDIRFKVPPIPAAASIYQPGSTNLAKTDKNQGAIVITAHCANGSVSNPIYCGLNAGKSKIRYFPAPPSLRGCVAFFLCDEAMHECGFASASGAWNMGDGVNLKLAIGNNSQNTQSVKISLNCMDGVPRGMKFIFFDPSTNSFTEMGKDMELQTHVAVTAGETRYYSLVAGNSEYCTAIKRQVMTMKTDLIGIFPNPFRQMVRIRFSLPFAFLGKVRFTIFDASGKLVWSITKTGRGGMDDFFWDGKNGNGSAIRSGLYLLQMQAWNSKGEIFGSFEKKLSSLP